MKTTTSAKPALQNTQGQAVSILYQAARRRLKNCWENCMRQILAAKAADPKADTSALEAQIAVAG
ncbi:hypothetical protein ACYULU_06945 [Breznakiellaceae bacterium SP9]